MRAYYCATALAFGLAFLSERARRVPVPDRHKVLEGRPRILPTLPAFFAATAGLVLVAMAALRWRRGTDYWQYDLNFPGYAEMPWTEMRLFNEPGIRVVSKLGQFIHDDSASMFAIAALITVGLTTWTIHRSTSYFALAILLYVLSTSWQGSFNGVRQYLACAILFAGHRLILDRRFWPYLLVVVTAGLFHLSALAFVLLYWMPRRKLGPVAMVVMLAASLFVLNSYEAVGAVIDAIQDDDISSGSYFARSINNWRVIVAIAPVALYLLFTVRDRLSEAGNFYVNMMFLHTSILFAALNSAYVARFAIYTGVYIAVAVPAMLNMENRKLRALLLLLVVVGYGAFWYLETSNTSSLVPFRWLWDR